MKAQSRFSFLWLSVLFLFSCMGSTSLELLGSGATFPEPLYKKMFYEYHAKTQQAINYQGIGSGGGIKQLIEKVTDFGATDVPMNQTEQQSAEKPVVTIPICMGAVAIIYFLPGVQDKIALNARILSDIYLGKIQKWNDKQIQSLNSNLTLPDLAISAVYRSDGSGTTFVFTSYLSAAVEEWKEKVGANKAPNWLTGIGAKGNPGISELVAKTPGALGYVELSYAIQNKISYADIFNSSGNRITPSIESITACSKIVSQDNSPEMLVNTGVPEGYPLSGFTWIIVYQEQKYNNRKLDSAQRLVKLLKWMVTEGQQYTAPLDYAPLSKTAADRSLELIASITFDGKKIEP